MKNRRSLSVYLTLTQLIKHGVHLGLQSTLTHSDSLKYLLPVRFLNFTLVNLKHTQLNLKLSLNLVIDMISKRGKLLLVNACSQIEHYLFDLYHGLNQPISSGLWVPGRLTNFRKIRTQGIKSFYLHKAIIKQYMTSEYLGTINLKTRNSISQIFNPARYKRTITRHILNMSAMPSISFISDSVLSSVCVNESFVLGLPSITLLDSGSMSSKLSYFVPGNSTSISSLLLYYNLFKNCIYQGLYKERYLFFLSGLKNKKIATNSLQFFKKTPTIDSFAQYSKFLTLQPTYKTSLFSIYNKLMKGALLYHTKALLTISNVLTTKIIPAFNLVFSSKLSDLKLHFSHILYLNSINSIKVGSITFDPVIFRRPLQLKNLENFTSLNFNFSFLRRRPTFLYLTASQLIASYNRIKYLNQNFSISLLTDLKFNSLPIKAGPKKFDFSTYYTFLRFYSR